MSAKYLLGRLGRLLVGLVLFGFSLSLLVQARLGLGPWDVLHQGIAERLDVRIGWVLLVVGVLVLLTWIPLRVRPGIGTIANVVVVAFAVNISLDLLPQPEPLAGRIGFLVAGILLNAVALGLYLGARMGPGPRDGVMIGLARRGLSIRTARTAMEVTVLVIGFALGGSVGIGTVAYALGIGPLGQLLLPRLEAPYPPVPEPEAVACASE